MRNTLLDGVGTPREPAGAFGIRERLARRALPSLAEQGAARVENGRFVLARPPDDAGHVPADARPDA